MHQSVLNRIEKGTRPARDREIRDIACFFDVSADYLLGIAGQSADTTSSSSAPVLSADELALIQKYRELDVRGRDAVSETLQHEYTYIHPHKQKKA
ncbi:MAG: helix-turn-helix domain-containing protein [Selenomonas sp.]|nr:helix-turn-helix domain-containing protein [Selenomonas sp.]